MMDRLLGFLGNKGAPLLGDRPRPYSLAWAVMAQMGRLEPTNHRRANDRNREGFRMPAARAIDPV
jgi:hypothetical protein